MFVYPDFEAKGIGTALLKKAEDFLFQYFQEICLETDARSRACAFYAQHGWRVGEHFENHDVKMMKQAR
jgi:GNAT superfamily N-acetyltransferase